MYSRKNKNLFQGIRQFFYPKEFRIFFEVDACVEAETIIDELKKIQEMSHVRKGPKDETIIQLVDNIWRSKKGLSAVCNRDDSNVLQRTLRLLKETEDIFKEANIQIEDLTGERYVEGLILKRLASQPCTEEIKKNCLINRPCNSQESSGGWIIEMIKPTVYRDKFLIRKGEVIVCQPKI